MSAFNPPAMPPGCGGSGANEGANTQTGQYSLRVGLNSLESPTKPVRVRCEQTRATININTATSATSTTWVAALQHSVEMGKDEKGTDLDNWVAFVPAVEFSATRVTKRNISVSGSGWIRVAPTTAASTAGDPNAVVTLRIY